MSNCGVGVRAFKQGIQAIALVCLGLVSIGLQAGTTPYHGTALTGPATDTDGSYTLNMGAWSTSPWSVNDTVLTAALTTRLNGSGTWTSVTTFSNTPISVAIFAVNRTGQGNGTHNYKADYLIYGTSTGYQVTQDLHNVVVTLSGGGGGDGITSPPSEVSTSEVGTLPMAMDVAANGDAVAAVPLQLLPGVAGFEPSLALTYNSGRAIERAERSLPEDTIGYGWRLSGLSQIRRCVVDQAPTASIGLNSGDSLCLDGIPLVRTNAVQHLAVGATYRTMIESYTKVEIKGASGALWFEVTAPDGTVMEYGNGGGSRVDHNGGTDYQWSINKATDTDGNVINYSYYHNAAKGINYPLNIEYDGAEIDFEYRTRTDAAAVSIGSASQTQSVFLHTIKVSMNNTMVREYRLLDEVVSSKRRLNKIQQCGYDQNGGNLTCLKATDINWTTANIVSQVGIAVVTVKNGLGAENHFVYGTPTGSVLFSGAASPFGNNPTPSGDYQWRSVSRNVVTKLRRDDGLGGDYDTNYAYQSQGVESKKHWGFLGFYAQRIHDEESGIYTYVQYRMDYPYFGSVTRFNQYDSVYSSTNVPLTQTETAYANHSKSYSGGITRLPYASRNVAYIYESDTPIGISETESAYSFDTPGYVTQVVTTAQIGLDSTTSGGSGVWGEVPNHTVTDVANTTRTTALFDNRTSGSNWLIGFVDDVTTESWKGGVGVGTAITQDATFTPQSDSLKVASLTNFPGHTTLNLTASYTYDAAGRNTAITVNGANVSSRTTQIGSSGFTDDRYPLNFTNAKSQTTTATHDKRFGIPKSITDPNGEVVSVERDAFGRVSERTNKDGITTTTSYIADTAITVNGVASVYRIENGSSTSPNRRTWFDKLGRAIRSEKQSLNGTSYSRVDTWYDTQGRVQKQSLPYFSTATPKYVTPTYDIRDRVTKITRPDSSYTDVTYSVSGNNVIVTVDDWVNDSDGSSSETQTKRSIYNILGQLESTVDAYGSTTAATTSYEYDANGNPTKVTAPGSAITTMAYDAAGNRTQLIGPNVGTVITTYTALGQVKTNKDNKNQTTTFNYDTLGRLTSRVSPDGTSNWVWDTATNGIGMLKSRTNNSGFVEIYSYNSDSKLSSMSTTITAIGASSGTTFTTSYTYDSSGRLLTTTYPSGYPVTREYSNGYLSKLKYFSSALQTFSSADAFGNITNESYLNGVATSRAYDAETGSLTSIDTTKGGTVIQDLEYKWRSNGTLESRLANPNSGISTTRKESFTYDALNRLTEAKTLINSSWSRDLDYSYNALGNITSKTSTKSGDLDATGYGYHATKKHAVTTATVSDSSGTANYTLTYDNNGAITKYDRAGTSLDRHIQYNAANQPIKIVVGNGLTDPNASVVEEFRYGPDGRRYARKTVWKDGSTTKEEHVSYIGDVEYITYVGDPSMLSTYKTRIGKNIMQIRSTALNMQYNPGGGYPFNLVFLESQRLEFAHRDHLGSVESVTDQAGNRLQQLAFEPYGSRKDSDWAQNIDSTELSNLLSNTLVFYPLYSGSPPLAQYHHARVARGFTGHEHLDRTGFIHMNGRVYDPELGRFLSPDPVIPEPSYSQSWNRYSYVYNSSLNFTDPSGFEPAEEGESPVNNDLTGSGDSTPWFALVGGPESPGAIVHNLLEMRAFWFKMGWLHGSYSRGASERTSDQPRLSEAANDRGFWDNPGAYLPSIPHVSEDTFAGYLWNRFLDGGVKDNLFRTLDSTLDAGEYAAQYWADIAVKSDHPLAFLANVPGVFASLWTRDTAADTVFTLGTVGVGGIIKGIIGPLKQWIRLGPSYSKALGKKISLSIRWGASPIGNGKYIKQIPSTTMQKFNQWLRKLKLPGKNWRTQDAGHLHLKE